MIIVASFCGRRMMTMDERSPRLVGTRLGFHTGERANSLQSFGSFESFDYSDSHCGRPLFCYSTLTGSWTMVSDKQTTESYAKTHPIEAFVREPLCLLWVLRHTTILIMFDDIRPWFPSPDSYHVQHIGKIFKGRQKGLLESKCLYSTANSEGVPRVHEGRLKDVEMTSSTNGKIK